MKACIWLNFLFLLDFNALTNFPDKTLKGSISQKHVHIPCSYFFQFSSPKSVTSTSSTYGSWLAVKSLLRYTWVYPQILIIKYFLLLSKSFSITRGFIRPLYNLSLLRYVNWIYFLHLFIIHWDLKKHNVSSRIHW